MSLDKDIKLNHLGHDQIFCNYIPDSRKFHLPFLKGGEYRICAQPLVFRQTSFSIIFVPIFRKSHSHVWRGLVCL